jgi:hypothetical protein
VPLAAGVVLFAAANAGEGAAVTPSVIISSHGQPVQVTKQVGETNKLVKEAKRSPMPPDNKSGDAALPQAATG